ncbi:F-box domain-containing protein [Mycena sanguinolenta]|uniref:F-box domain-containing protein n=1 Tax=Mycena sanguinolenta TaxID=230812 RepID=A0A8H6YEP7_9AGAR|nr:F-box domain-containing protein [Mycena sanguinolenta]
MTLTPASRVHAAVFEQTERTRQCSRTDIQRFIEESESKIISLDSQITALMELRDSQRACILALRYIISPIRALPVELLAEIFDLAIQDDTHIQDVYQISHVCSHWRRLAHNTPRLWARPLTVDLSEDSEKDAADGLKAWLECSAPLSLPISFMPVHVNMNPAIREEVLRVVSRLGSLQMPIRTLSSLVRQLGKCRLDNLEELELEGIEDDTDPTPPLAFTAVPRLQKLSIINCPIAYHTLVPWAQLTELTIGASPDTTLGVLSHCANLFEVFVINPGWPQFPEAGPDLVVLGQLRSLRLEIRMDSGDIAQFLNYLSTPLLQTFRVDVVQAQRWTQASLTAFQLRAPNITQLQFGFSQTLTSENLVAVTFHAPSLTHLTLTYCNGCFDDAFIRTLYHKDGVTPAVPCLHSLVVWQGSDTVSLTEDFLAGMIASRWWSDTELASYLAPPAVARWTRVEFEMGTYAWGPQFEDILKDIPSDVLRY